LIQWGHVCSLNALLCYFAASFIVLVIWWCTYSWIQICIVLSFPLFWSSQSKRWHKTQSHASSILPPFFFRVLCFLLLVPRPSPLSSIANLEPGHGGWVLPHEQLMYCRRAMASFSVREGAVSPPTTTSGSEPTGRFPPYSHLSHPLPHRRDKACCSSRGR
jgi:hypothetical protein